MSRADAARKASTPSATSKATPSNSSAPASTPRPPLTADALIERAVDLQHEAERIPVDDGPRSRLARSLLAALASFLDGEEEGDEAAPTSTADRAFAEPAAARRREVLALGEVPARGLGEASLADLLLHALTPEGNASPSLAVLGTLADDVGALVRLAYAADGDIPIDARELAPTLENLHRRLNVAIELCEREHGSGVGRKRTENAANDRGSR